jgi:hypothetical protein
MALDRFVTKAIEFTWKSVHGLNFFLQDLSVGELSLAPCGSPGRCEPFAV